MTNTTEPVRPAQTVAEISKLAELDADALTLVATNADPERFVGALVQQELYADAVRFLAHTLPKREGIWWAWVCARRSAGTEPSPEVTAALNATERWVTQPTDDYRRAAMPVAEAAGFDTSAGCAALAVFLSGGSIAPPDVPPVPPGEFLTAKAITGAVVAAAVSTEPERAPEKFKAFNAQGVDVVHRLGLWQTS
jgi:hypothetical protein